MLKILLTLLAINFDMTPLIAESQWDANVCTHRPWEAALETHSQKKTAPSTKEDEGSEDSQYSVFGEEQIIGDVLSPWRYAGKRIDVETGFIISSRERKKRD